MSNPKYWLLKAEPDSRIVKGKDVKFSVDDFEKVKTSPWEGVRNHEAKNLMKEMAVGDKALFYHSSCKIPGVAAFAEVSKNAYPDYTAWDASHPYYDARTDESEPKWYMVDLTFTSRANNFVPLALLKYIAESTSIPDEVSYIGDDGFQAVKTMDLVTRGRLSVQRIQPKAWDAIQLLAENGGWEEMDLRPKKSGSLGNKKASEPSKAKGRPQAPKRKKKAKAKVDEEDEAQDDDDDDDDEYESEEIQLKPAKASPRKRKAPMDDDDDFSPRRRSTRMKK